AAGALEDVRAWLEAAPQDAEAHHRRGEALASLGDPSGARDAFARASLLAPTEPRHHAALAEARAALGDARGALTSYDRAVALEACVARAGARALRGEHEPAVDDLSHALARAPAAPSIPPKGGGPRMRRGDIPGARADLDRAIALDPGHGEALLRRGELRVS